jgi:CHASE2 domain-containing sensor protein
MALHRHRLFKPGIGAAVTVLCGLLLWATPRGDAWVNASYDYLFRFCTRVRTRDVVLIQMDNKSFDACDQSRKKAWDRGLHADLLNRLADDGCRLVVLDTWLREPGDTEKDAALAKALRRQRSVVLMADFADSSVRHLNSPAPGVDSLGPSRPVEPFLSAANGNWGVGRANQDKDLTVRRHWPFPAPASLPSLPWTAALLAHAKLFSEPQEQWIRYYSRDGAWDTISYCYALEQKTNYFHDKIVFIGNKPASLVLGDGESDKVGTAYTRWTSEAVGGVEIMATEFLNLLNSDWLRRPAWWIEIAILIGGGALLGGGLFGVGRVWACCLAAVAVVVVFFVAIGLTQLTNFWFPWLIIVGGQVPAALVWALVAGRFGSLEDATTVRDVSHSAQSEPVQAPINLGVPDAPDYEISGPPFGEGSFGKVWVARTSIGEWVALKAVYQARFGSNPKPYEREFNGLKRYMPISYKHPGLLRINFISRKKREGYFYYVMELGDALEPGWEQKPSSYTPRDLAKVLARAEGRRLPASECLRICKVLADALDFLHSQKLTHGDVKPQNIIFVDDQPKLADVGLVNELLDDGLKRTVTGTPGYMRLGYPSGTPEADIYALGMVLYVMFMGMEPEHFPEVTTGLAEDASRPYFVNLNSIILRACHPDPSRSFASAHEMAMAMREAQATLEHESPIGVQADGVME